MQFFSSKKNSGTTNEPQHYLFLSGYFFKYFLVIICTAICFLGILPKIADAAELVNGGHISGSIVTEDEIDSHTFTAEAGQHIEIHLTETESSVAQPRLELYGPSGGDPIIVQQQHITAQAVLTIEETGTYTILVQDGYGGTHQFDYNIYYVNIPGADELGELVNAGVRTESIDLGDLDTYTFTAEAGEHIEIHLTETASSTAQPRLELYGPSGGDPIITHQHHTTAQAVLTIEETGTYTILVQDGYGGTHLFDYNVYYVNIPGADELGELVNAGVRTESIDLGDLDTYTFTAEAGEHIEIHLTETESSVAQPRLELYGPSGGDPIITQQQHTTAQAVLTIEETGTYTILVQDGYGGTHLFDYNIYYVNIPEADELGELVNAGVRTESIDLGDLDTYTFTAEAGEHIEIHLTETESSDAQPRLELYGPSGGDPIITHQHHTTSQAVLTIEETGTYTVLVQDGYGGTHLFDYNVYYVNIPGADELGELVNAGVRTESIVLGDLDTYTFTAEAGQHIEIHLTETESSVAQPRLELYGPSGGDPIITQQQHTTAQAVLTIEETGTYTILVQDGYGGTHLFDYNIYYVNIPGANEHGELTNENELEGTIELGDLDTFTFSAESGENIELYINETESSDAQPRLELYGPSGGDPIITHQHHNTAQAVLTIEETGTYTILVQDGYGGTHLFDYNINYITDAVEYPCGDLDHDMDVDRADRNILRGAFRTSEGDEGFIEEADYDGDGNIDYSDYQLWYKCYKDYAASQQPE